MKTMDTITNVLAERYATKPLCEIWSPVGKIKLERELWIAVLKAQRDLGLPIPAEAVESYEQVKDQVDLAAIEERERITRHDVKARIEEFCRLAGHQQIHKGMTSRDLTENVEQLQVVRSLELTLSKAVSVLLRIGARAQELRDLVLSARTHNVAAQPTTLGKRMAMFGEELKLACERLENLYERYPARGLKGATGTQLDTLTLFKGDMNRVRSLEAQVLKHLGLRETLGSVGQVYPRSLDFDVVSALYQLASAPSSFAKTLRLMAGHELASEGFAKGQVGSSAMPHKMNSRSCERINALQAVLSGHVTMASRIAGDQWNEGDVSCSVVRRVVLPDSFFAADGLLETTLVVLDQMEVFPEIIRAENAHYLPFLSTTTILMKAVQAGAGREEAHEAIKEHAVSTVKDLRTGGVVQNDLMARLAKDTRLRLSLEDLEEILQEEEKLTGAAKEQVDAFCESLLAWSRRYPQAASYKPGSIL